MSTTDDSVIAIADSYAQALLDLSEQQGASDRVSEELSELTAGMRWDEALKHFLTSPAIDDDARERTMEKAFRGRMSDLLLNTLLVMNAKGRSSIMATFQERYRLALARKRGEVDVRVTTAVPLPKKSRSRLVEVLQEVTGLRPTLIEETDEGVLGGLVVQVGDQKLDCTISSQLRRLRESLQDRASREIHAGKEYFEGVEGK